MKCQWSPAPSPAKIGSCLSDHPPHKFIASSLLLATLGSVQGADQQPGQSGCPLFLSPASSDAPAPRRSALLGSPDRPHLFPSQSTAHPSTQLKHHLPCVVFPETTGLCVPTDHSVPPRYPTHSLILVYRSVLCGSLILVPSVLTLFMSNKGLSCLRGV